MNVGARTLRCICASAYQDEHYGPGMRVCNALNNTRDKDCARCTVCGRAVPIPFSQRPEPGPNKKGSR